MKKNYIILVLAILFSGITIAQEAQKNFINYQGVARNGADQLMANESMTIGIALKMGNSAGAAAYAENHSVTTDANGVFSLKIGNGDAVSGEYHTIPWGSGATFVTVLINGAEIGTTEMMAVPYALSSGDGSQTATEVPYDNGTSGLAATNAQEAIDELVGSGAVDADADPANELQHLSLDGTNLKISDGTGVDLAALIPPGGTDDQNASEVPFDNSTSTLTATDTQAAIEELAAGGLVDTDDQDLSLSGTLLQISDGTGVDLAPIIPPGGTDDQIAGEVPYDNTISALAATDTQAAIDELATSGLVDTDDQDLSLSGTTLQITDGASVDLSPIIPAGGTDDQNAAEVSFDNTASGLAATDAQAAIDELATSGLVDTDDQALVLTGDVLSIEDGAGSVDLSTYRDDADADPNNEIQTISFDAVTNEISLTDGGTVTIPGGGSGLTLPYYDEVSGSGAAFHVQNNFLDGRYGLAGSVGPGAEVLIANNAGVMGAGVNGHGVYGHSENGIFAGVHGVSNSADGVGVQGYGFGGGVGGHFYTTSAGVAALTTGRGNVGIGISEPEMKMHVAGDLFVQTNFGDLVLGFPNNGNQWQMSTRGQGADLQFQHKPVATNSFLTRFRMRQDGEFQVGDIGAPSAWAHIRNNSNVDKPHLKLEEEGNDYARLELTNNQNSRFWHLAGYVGSNTAQDRFNIFNSNVGNIFSVHGNGNIVVNGSIAHSSDRRLKRDVISLPYGLETVMQLAPKAYYWKKDEENDKRVLGLIAQDVQPIINEVVHGGTNDEDMLSISYAELVPVLIKAIQEQQEIIQQFKSEQLNTQTELSLIKKQLSRFNALLDNNEGSLNK